MNNSPAEKKANPLARLVIGVVCIALLGYLVSEYRLLQYQNAVDDQLDSEQARLITVAELNANNQLTDEVTALVRDCSVTNRVRFDTLLGSLDAGLSAVELAELRVLFDQCASYYADRKLAMAQQLEASVGVLEQKLSLYDTLHLGTAESVYDLASWQDLVGLEFEQATRAGELVAAQRDIIDLLITGKVATDQEIVSILEQVAEVKEAEVYAKTQAVSLLEEIKN